LFFNMSTHSILGRTYDLRRIPLRLIVNGDPCDAFADFVEGEIIVGDRPGTDDDDDRDALVQHTASAVLDAVASELARAGVKITSPALTPAIPSRGPSMTFSGCFPVVRIYPKGELDPQWDRAMPRRGRRRQRS